MRTVVQRVLRADCTVDGRITGQIEKGFCLFVGFAPDDDQAVLEKMVRKIVGLRIFEDEEGKMNRSLLQIGGSVLSISQFTLYADTRRGNRPGFSAAAPAQQGKMLYDSFNCLLEKQVPVQKGIYGADMKISLVNDGPVTIILDSDEWNRSGKGKQ